MEKPSSDLEQYVITGCSYYLQPLFLTSHFMTNRVSHPDILDHHRILETDTGQLNSGQQMGN